MEINVIQEKDNPLFSRKEIKLAVAADVTPSMAEAKKIVAEKYSSDEDLIRVREVQGKFGSSVFSVVADIYSSKEEFNRIVKKTKQELKAEEEAKKAAFEAKKAEKEAKKAEEEAKKVEAEAPKEEEAKTE